MAVEVDSLQIKIKADAKTATGAINKLRASLVTLNDALRGGGASGLLSLSNALSKLADGSQELKSFATGVRSMSKAMDASVGSMKQFQNVMLDTAMIAGTAAQQMKDMGVQEFLSQTDKDTAATLNDTMTALIETMQTFNANAETTGERFEQLSAKTGKAEKSVKSLGKTARSTSKETKQLGNAMKDLTKPLQKILSSFGRIAFYRMIRSAIKAITSSVKEGLTNLKSYSETVGTAFAPAVDNLRRHVLLLKNAFATALRPVIEAIIPVIIKLCDWLSRAADFVAQVFSVLTGKVDDNGRYTKAVLSDLEQSNKQAKELRRTLLGFDEINRLDGDNGSGESSSAGLQFVQADVSENAVKVAGKLETAIEKIKNFLNGIDWNVVIRVLEILGALKLVEMLGKVAHWLVTIGLKSAIIIGIIYALAEYGDKIAAAIDKSRAEVDAWFNNLKSKVQGSEGLTALIQLVQDIFDTFSEGFSTLSSGVYKLFHGDFKGALKDLVHLVAVIVKGIIKIIAGIWNVVAGLFEDIVYWLSLGVKWFHNNVIRPVANFLATLWAKIKTAVHNAVIDLKIGWQEIARWLVSKLNEWILLPIQNAINNAIAEYNRIFKKNVEPITMTIDTTKFDEKIDELKETKWPPVTETVELVAEWTKDPDRIKLTWDTTGIENAVDNIEKGLNSAIDKIGKKISSYNKMVTDMTGALKPGAQGGRSYTTYASGGFPNVGSVFIAGEAGPEYVGSINGQTGVWNSDQMAQALYNAVASAMAQYSGGGDIYLDGEVIYRNTVRRNNNQVRSTGRSALLT